MKRKEIIILLFLSFAMYTQSQITWNAKAGINLSRVTSLDNVDLKPGYQLGVGADYFFNERWGVQSSLMLISKGFNSKGDYTFPFEPELNVKSYDVTENSMYIEIPLMLAHRITLAKNVKLVLNGGGYISYGIGGKIRNTVTMEDGSTVTYHYNTFDIEDERFDLGIATGISLEYNRYSIGLIGDFGLKNVSQSYKDQSLGLNLGYKNQTLGLNLGYKF